MLNKINELNQFIQNRIIDIDNDIESLEEELKNLKLKRKEECENFKKVDEMKKLYKEITEEVEEEKKEVFKPEDRCRKCDRKESTCACWN